MVRGTGGIYPRSDSVGWVRAGDRAGRNRGNFQIVHYRRRGYAGSSRALAGMTMQGWAGDCIALLNHLGIASAHVRAKRQKPLEKSGPRLRGPKKNEREAPLGVTKKTSVVVLLPSGR